MSQEITANDLVMYGGNKDLMAGGYKVDSILYGGKPFNQSYDKHKQTGGAALTLFNDLAVPAGLLLTQQYAKKRYYEKNDSGFLSENMHDRLLDLMSSSKKASEAKKPKIEAQKSKKTKKVSKK